MWSFCARVSCQKIYSVEPAILPLAVFHRNYGYVHVEKKLPSHPLGPGFVWRKCYVVRPTTETTHPLKKFQWLTKSVFVDGLPEATSSLQPPEDGVTKDFETRACDYLAFQIRNRSRTKGLYDRATVHGLLETCLTSVWPLAKDYRHLRTSHMTFSPNVECYWRRNADSFVTQTQPLYVMHTNIALGLLCDSNFAGGVLDEKQYLPRHLGLFKHSFDQILPFGGSRRFSPSSMTHTVFIFNEREHSPEKLYAQGLMQLFSQSTAEAVQGGFKIDQDLPYPMVSQGIITDGRDFTFVAFQLNTLDLRKDSESSKCNVFYGGPILRLYEAVNEGAGLEDFNKECAELIINFLLHEPLRRRLRMFGGRSRAMTLDKVSTDGQQRSPTTREEWEVVHAKLN